MKIAISFPPLESEKGIPLLAQNRQFQWFNNPTYIYPMIPAYTATLLKKNGYDVIWDDGIAEGLSYKKWLDRIIREKPDVVVIETKTPVVKRHWEIVNDLKSQITNSKCQTNSKSQIQNSKPIVVLVGDHVTALPEESMKNCRVNFVIQGGDFDFILLNICQSLKKDRIGNWKLSTQGGSAMGGEIGNLKKGVWYRENDEIKNTGQYDLNSHSLDELPMIDRELTKWRLYAYKNGNYKYTPGSYMMSARDCWHGKCTFCSWANLFPGKNFRVRSPEKVLDEVGSLIDLGVKEIMEDSGTLPVGKWLEEFCQGMIERGYNKKIVMSCNMRINGIRDIEIWKLMKKTGFRFILFGLESASQKTLNRINKNLKIEEIEPGLKICKEAGLEPHITAMIGYSWETKEDAQRTVDLAKNLFKKGYVDTLQATIVIPYPGTSLYKYCKKNDLLNFNNYDRFDQREQVMKSKLTTEDVKELTQGLYKSFMTPKFIVKKIFNIRNLNDIKFLWRAGFKVWGHLTDFEK